MEPRRVTIGTEVVGPVDVCFSILICLLILRLLQQLLLHLFRIQDLDLSDLQSIPMTKDGKAA